RAIREAERALGRVDYSLPENAARNRVFARSLFVVRDIRKGERFTSDNVRSIRPGCGLPPGRIASVIGKKAAESIRRGTPLARRHITR
ncbi:MAG TPA: SAF domain-containing protein, partial [Elusimicrobiales bacterium]|nr:SAF domain-containing protein [Elusimicrobiales bacterium]